MGGHFRILPAPAGAAGGERCVTMGAAQSLTDAVVTFRELGQDGCLAARKSYRCGVAAAGALQGASPPRLRPLPIPPPPGSPSLYPPMQGAGRPGPDAA